MSLYGMIAIEGFCSINSNKTNLVKLPKKLIINELNLLVSDSLL